MATIIDALVVTLGLDPKQFKQGQKEALDSQKKFKEEATKGTKEVEAQATKATASFAKLRNELMGLAAAFVGMAALKSFADKITQTDANTSRMARSMNMSAKELTTWQGVATRAGGTADGIAASFKNITNQFEAFSVTGAPNPAAEYFRSLKINAADAYDKLRPMTDLALEVSEKFQGMTASRAHFLGAGMGYDSATVDMLMKGPKYLREELALQDKRAEKTQEELVLAENRTNAWNSFKDVVADIGTKVMTQLTPAILGLIDVMDGIAQFLRNNVPLVDAMLLGLGAIGILKFAGLISTLATLAGAFAATAGAAGALAVTASVLSGVGLVAGAVVLAGGVYYGYQALTGTGKTKSGSTPIAESLPAGELESLLAAQRQQESGGRHRNADGSLVTSRSGARGVAQIMPATGANPGYGVKPLQNDSEAEHRRFQKDYMTALMGHFGGDQSKALAAYNWGPGNVDRDPSMSHAPMETRNYGPSILRMAGGARFGKGGGSTNNSSTEVRVGTMNIQTQATDAPGIAKSIGPALERFAFASQANAGLN